MLISLAFQRYIERPKRSPYVAWAYVFVRPAPAVRTGLANKSDFNVDWALNSIFAWALVICVLVMSSSLDLKVWVRKVLEEGAPVRLAGGSCASAGWSGATGQRGT